MPCAWSINGDSRSPDAQTNEIENYRPEEELSTENSVYGVRVNASDVGLDVCSNSSTTADSRLRR